MSGIDPRGIHFIYLPPHPRPVRGVGLPSQRFFLYANAYFHSHSNSLFFFLFFFSASPVGLLLRWITSQSTPIAPAGNSTLRRLYQRRFFPLLPLFATCHSPLLLHQICGKNCFFPNNHDINAYLRAGPRRFSSVFFPLPVHQGLKM